MTANIYIYTEIIHNKTLIDVIRQFKSYDNPSDVTVFIDSSGGNKYEGDAIYNYLINLGIPVKTVAARAYSIAAKIFMAGDVREVADANDVVGIHYAWVNTSGNAAELQEVVDQLAVLDKEFIAFYSEKLNVDKDTIANMLENETILSGKEAVALGFATQIKQNIDISAKLNLNKNEMKEEKKNFLNKFKEIIESYLKEDIKNELILQDGTGQEVVFPDLDAADTPGVGDMAMVNGQPAQGTYIFPSLDNREMMFEDGVAVETQEEDPEAVFDAYVDRIENKIKNKLTVSWESKLLEKEKEIEKLNKELKKIRAEFKSPEIEIKQKEEEVKAELTPAQKIKIGRNYNK